MKNGVTLRELAAQCQGELIGDGAIVVEGIEPLERAKPGQLSFYAPRSTRNAKFLLDLLRKSQASAFLVGAQIEDFDRPQIVVKNPYGTAITLISRFYAPPKPKIQVHPTAVVAESALLGEGVSIGPYVVIGERTKIGDRTIIHPHVVIYDDVTIGPDCCLHAHAVVRERSELGADCLIQSGVVIGGDGFGYIPNPKTGHQRIPHSGRTILEDRVDLGANTTVDRATFGETRIGAGSKIDNLVMVGHNDVIGKNAFICSQVGLSGSVTVGDNVTLAGQVGVADHVAIGDNVRAAARAGITSDIPSGIDIGGFPAQPAREWRREIANIRRIKELLGR